MDEIPRWPHWINLFVAVWLMVAPTFGFTPSTGSAAAWNSYLVGLTLMCIAIWGLDFPGRRAVQLTAIVVVWLVATTLAFVESNAWPEVMNYGLAGAVVIVNFVAAWRHTRIPSRYTAPSPG